MKIKKYFKLCVQIFCLLVANTAFGSAGVTPGSSLSPYTSGFTNNSTTEYKYILSSASGSADSSGNATAYCCDGSPCKGASCSTTLTGGGPGVGGSQYVYLDDLNTTYYVLSYNIYNTNNEYYGSFSIQFQYTAPYIAASSAYGTLSIATTQNSVGAYNVTFTPNLQ